MLIIIESFPPTILAEGHWVVGRPPGFTACIFILLEYNKLFSIFTFLKFKEEKLIFENSNINLVMKLLSDYWYIYQNDYEK